MATDLQTLETLLSKSYKYPFRSTVAQSVASFFISMTFYGLGVQLMVPMVALGNLINAKDNELSLNQDQGSWLGGLPFLVMPVGIVLAVLVQDYVGQRYALILSDLTGLFALIAMHLARDITALTMACALTGVSIGLLEPAGMSYISEICEPKVRGFLSSLAMLLSSLGIFFMSVIVAVVDWRTSMLISCAAPTLAILVLLLIPDSPSFLLSKGRQKKALRALTWYRGWISEKEVAEEFEDLRTYVKKSFAYVECPISEEAIELAEKDNVEAPDVKPLSMWDLLLSLGEWRTLYPFFLICAFQTLVCLVCAVGAAAYIMTLFDTLHTSVDRDYIVIAYGAAMPAGNLSVTLLIKCVGKRPMAVFGIFATALTEIALGVYVHYHSTLQLPWLFIFLIFLLTFVGAHPRPIPIMLIGEVFSVKNRHFAGGLIAVAFDLIIFVFIATYFTLNDLLGTPMYFISSGVVGIVGSVFLYRYLPETEGKSLAEINQIFSAKSPYSRGSS